MAHISFYLPCEPFWHEGIYQLETSDFATGYDPVLGTDGPANRQWKELGDRTLFLKAFFETAHKNGHHQIRACDFAADTKIPESKLKLDYDTDVLALKISEIESGAKRAYEIVNLRNSQELSPGAILVRILPSIREYYHSGAEFDLLGATAQLREFTSVPILKEITGDDSLDVASTRGIYPGNTYFLMDEDGSRLEAATVLSVLTDTRVRFTSALGITRNAGLLSAANLPPGSEGLEIFRDFVWQSDWTDALAGKPYGRLFIHRDSGSVNGRVFWQGTETDSWHEAEFASCDSFYDGTCDDVFILPGTALRLRVEYPACASPWKMYWVALRAEKELIFPETVKRPQIENAELSGKSLTVHGCPYASLWALPQGGLEMRAGIKDGFAIPPRLYSVHGKSDGMRVTLDPDFIKAGRLTVAIRYSDIEGTNSRWSNTIVLGDASGE